MKQPYNCAYEGKCPVKKGDKVSVLVDPAKEQWAPGIVRTCCAIQFTARVAKHTLFFFYSDQGDTWKVMQQ